MTAQGVNRCWITTAMVLALACGDGTTSGPVPGAPILSIELSRLALPVGESATVDLIVRNADGSAVLNPVVTYASTDDQVVSVDAAGLVMGQSIGSATVRATFEGVSADLPVGVVASATFAQDVEPILDQGCAISGCHITPDPQEGMDLSEGHAFASIVNVPANQSSLHRVQPGDPDGSYLIIKLQGTIDTADGSGSRMPLNRQPLSAATLDIIRAWIQTGANNN
jgi:hypothetical protein